jgi:hypothetical protein
MSDSPALQAAEAIVAAARTRVEKAAAMLSTFKRDDLTLRKMRAHEEHGIAHAEFEQAQAKAADVRNAVVEAVQAQDAPGLRALVRELSEILAPAEEVNAKIIEYQIETARKTGGRSQPPAGFAPLEATDLIYFWRQSARENGYLD